MPQSYIKWLVPSSIISPRKSDLVFVAPDLVFVAPGFEIVAAGLEIGSAGLENIYRAAIVKKPQTGRHFGVLSTSRLSA
jgi:hypothetical protein